jgi:hypothetical protein
VGASPYRDKKVVGVFVAFSCAASQSTFAQFMVMLTSSNSKFDHYRRNEAGGTLTSDETAGYAVLKPNVLLVTLLI